MILPAGTRVHLPGLPTETATVLGYGLCDCGLPAYSVKRDPGSFTSWRDDAGQWHAEQAVPLDDAAGCSTSSTSEREARQ